MGTANSDNTTEKVLANYELLQHILSYLSFQDLIHAQQVCYQWRALVARSKILRQLLFLEGIDDRRPLDLQGKHNIAGWNLHFDYTPHPLFEAVCVPHSRTRWMYGLLFDDVKRLLSFHGTQWQSMFVVQPPPKKVLLRVHLNTWASVVSTHVEDAGGVRFESVLSSLVKLLNKNGVTESSQQWLNERSGRDQDGRILIISG